MPSPISVNIFGLRFTSDAQKRSKNGQPPQITTGDASKSSIPFFSAGSIRSPSASPAIESTSKGSDSAALTHNRLRIESYSGSACSPATISIGSRAIPQIGQLPGPICTISGCIGHVYRMFCGLAAGADGSGHGRAPSRPFPAPPEISPALFRTALCNVANRSSTFSRRAPPFPQPSAGPPSFRKRDPSLLARNPKSAAKPCLVSRLLQPAFRDDPWRPDRRKKLLRRLLKPLPTTRAAEVVALPAMLHLRPGLFRIDIHAANWIALHVSRLALCFTCRGRARPALRSSFTANACKPIPAIRRTSPPLPSASRC